MISHSLELEAFVERMALATIQGGAVANAFRGRIKGSTKPAEHMEADRSVHRWQREAISIVDVAVQEVLLLAAQEALKGCNALSLDAEERSPTRDRFVAVGEGHVTLIIDPIDGSAEYLSGRDKFSVCVGLVIGGKLLSSIVYFPMRDHLFLLSSEGLPVHAIRASEVGLSGAEELTSSVHDGSNLVYINSRVPHEVQSALAEAGFVVRDDMEDNLTCPDAILECLHGRAVAYVASTRQIRDMLLGPIMARTSGGFELDWNLNGLVWPQGGRVPHAIFGTHMSGQLASAMNSAMRVLEPRRYGR